MRIIVNSVPKTGTHLISRAMELLGVSTEVPMFVSSATASLFAANADETTINIGVGMPVPVSCRKLHERLSNLEDGQIVTAHAPYSPELEQLLDGLQFRMILAMRDPRDVAVSLAFHIAREKMHRLHELFQTLSREQQILLAITGFERNGRILLESISRRFGSVIPWTNWPNCKSVRFEDLVGKNGGGSSDRQMMALEAISQHIGTENHDLSFVAANLFGGGPTFRKGTSGQWQEHFTSVHNAAFEQQGDILKCLGYA